jgi:hypothetical protein
MQDRAFLLGGVYIFLLLFFNRLLVKWCTAKSMNCELTKSMLVTCTPIEI